MGCGSSKGADEALAQEIDGDSAAVPNTSESSSGGTPEKHKTFRERRLSMSQLQEASNGNGNNRRRLSVYGNSMDSEASQPSVVVSPLPSVGVKTMGGFEPVPGGSTAKINQDRGLAVYPFLGEDNVGLFGVYDGHGRAGEKVSEFVIQNLPPCLEAKRDTLWSDPGEALTSAYITVDTDLAKACDASVSGTTAVTVLIKDRHLWLANSGDSRAVMLRSCATGLQAIDLTIDHKPDSVDEMKRILSMGGHVTPVFTSTGLRAHALPCVRCACGEAHEQLTNLHFSLHRAACPDPNCDHLPLMNCRPCGRRGLMDLRHVSGITCEGWQWRVRLVITTQLVWV